MAAEPESLIEYPCDFPIKVLGKTQAGFAQTVLGVVRAEATKSLKELRVSGRAEHAPRRLRDWLGEEARRDLDARVLVHTRALGVKAKRIAIRDQATRWGSCSTTGVLSFSWRLILAPPFVLDYLAAHEVAHLVEMNHSRRFWRLVERLCPGMMRAKAWLDAHGTDLHRYGTSGTRPRLPAARPVSDTSDL